MEPSYGLKSEINTRQIFVAFQNITGRNIDMIWIDFEGIYRNCKTIVPEQVVQLDTYAHHPWLFIDSATKDRMQVESKPFFYAEKHLLQFRIVDSKITRKILLVHLPMRSLKTLALFAVRNMLKTADEVDQLDLPMMVKMELAVAIDLKNLPLHPPNEFIQID